MGRWAPQLPECVVLARSSTGSGIRAMREVPASREAGAWSSRPATMGLGYIPCAILFPPSKLIMEITMETACMYQKSIFHLNFVWMFCILNVLNWRVKAYLILEIRLSFVISAPLKWGKLKKHPISSSIVKNHKLSNTIIYKVILLTWTSFSNRKKRSWAVWHEEQGAMMHFIEAENRNYPPWLILLQHFSQDIFLTCGTSCPWE